MMTFDGITLDHDLQWEDEFKFTYGTGTAERALDGSIVIQQRTITGGRPITLVGTESSGWLSRATLVSLVALTQDISRDFTLTIGEGADERTFTVRFRHEDQPVLDFTPITLVPDAPPDDFWYYGTIKLRTVTAV